MQDGKGDQSLDMNSAGRIEVHAKARGKMHVSQRQRLLYIVQKRVVSRYPDGTSGSYNNDDAAEEDHIIGVEHVTRHTWMSGREQPVE